jgi:hypothetical protein
MDVILQVEEHLVQYDLGALFDHAAELNL